MGEDGARGGGKVSGRVAAYERRRRLRQVGLLGGAAAVTMAALVVVASAPTSVVPAGGPPECTSDRAGQPACGFAVPLVNRAGTFDLSGAGGPTLIEFMGSHCTSCEAQMPTLNEVSSAYRAQGLTMVSLDVGGVLGTEDPQDAIDFMARNGGDWDIALDNEAIAIEYGVVSLPTIFLVDAGGTIVYRTGFTSTAKLSEQIEPLL
ncbi:MAG TPA: TlpA disulfide reductase family protein [Candidatus Thermoplasmatota archaeon]